jgi:hypothetical protein
VEQIDVPWEIIAVRLKSSRSTEESFDAFPENITTLKTHVALFHTRFMDLFHSIAEWNTSYPDANVKFA